MYAFHMHHPDNLAEVGWRDLIVEVPDDDLPPLGSTASFNVLALCLLQKK